MSDYLLVIALSLFMFISTFFLGYAPTKIKTSQRVMNLIAIFGAGLLVGAALIVIVPEGMDILYQALHNIDAVEDAKKLVLDMIVNRYL